MKKYIFILVALGFSTYAPTAMVRDVAAPSKTKTEFKKMEPKQQRQEEYRNKNKTRTRYSLETLRTRAKDK